MSAGTSQTLFPARLSHGESLILEPQDDSLEENWTSSYIKLQHYHIFFPARSDGNRFQPSRIVEAVCSE